MAFLASVRWGLVVPAAITTALTVWLLVWMLIERRPRTQQPRSDRRRPSTDHGDPREALALVGDALAATHNPRVLLPVILEVITEATGALGGQIFSGAEEVAWIGEVGGSRKPMALELDGTTRLM